MDGWVRKVVHPYNGIALSLKEEGILTPATACMSLEDITLSAISQTQKDKPCLIPPI